MPSLFVIVLVASTIAIGGALASTSSSTSTSDGDSQLGWVLITDLGADVVTASSVSTANNDHLRREWMSKSSLLGGNAKEQALWRAGVGRTHVFVAPQSSDLSHLIAKSSPLVMRSLEQRLWLATRKMGSSWDEQACNLARNALDLLNADVIGAGTLEVWEGERGHEADGSPCFDVIPVFTSPIIVPTRDSPPESLTAYLASHLANDAGDARIHDLVARINETRLRETVEALSNFTSRQSNSDGAKLAQQWLVDQYTALGLSVSTHSFIDTYSQNVIAELPSTQEGDRLVIVSGHYDSRAINSSDPSLRAPGADDNGTGTAASLELARVIIASGLQFAYTIRFCAWSGEEQGLRGSAQYAKELREAGADVVAVFNGDMLGYNRPGTALTLGMKDLYITPWLLSVANTVTSVYVPDLTIASSASCCSDHQSFFQNGFPAIGYFESKAGASDYPSYHKVTDVPTEVNYGLHRRIAGAMVAAVATMAVPLPL